MWSSVQGNILSLSCEGYPLTEDAKINFCSGWERGGVWVPFGSRYMWRVKALDKIPNFTLFSPSGGTYLTKVQKKSLRHLICVCLIEIKQSQIYVGFNLLGIWVYLLHWLVFYVWLFVSYCESDVRIAMLWKFMSGDLVFSCSEFLVGTNS